MVILILKLTEYMPKYENEPGRVLTRGGANCCMLIYSKICKKHLCCDITRTIGQFDTLILCTHAPIYPGLLLFTPVYSCLHLLTRVYPCLPVFTYVHPCLPMFTCVYLWLPLFTHVYLCLLLFTYVYSCLPMFT